MHYTQIILQPVVTEKITALKDSRKQVAFIVHPKANKIEIKKAVETLFNVKVMAVNVVNYVARECIRNRRKIHISGHRKAYITLYPNEKIAFFEGI